MRRLAILGFALAPVLALGVAQADIAPPPLQFVNVTAGGLRFLIIERDYTAPARPSAQLIGCEEGQANCALAHARGLIGERLVGLDGAAFSSGSDLRQSILDAFARSGAPATIELDFEPTAAGGAPNRVAFARR